MKTETAGLSELLKDPQVTDVLPYKWRKGMLQQRGQEEYKAIGLAKFPAAYYH